MKVAGATFIVAGGNPRPPALNDSPETWLQAFKFQLIICVLSHNYLEERFYGYEMTQTALNHAVWSFFLSCFLFFFLMHGMNCTSLKRTPNKEKQNS